MEIKKGIEKAVKEITAELKKLSKPIQDRKEIAQVATISANGDTEIGEIIAKAMERVGKDGTITVEEGKGFETTLDVVEGMNFDRGYLSAYFIDKCRSARVRPRRCVRPDLREENRRDERISPYPCKPLQKAEALFSSSQKMWKAKRWQRSSSTACAPA